MTIDLESTLRELDLDLPPRTVDQLRDYRDRLFEAAQRFNLTAVRDRNAIEVRHIVESLALAHLLQQRELIGEGTRIVDIGTGAGLPGLPIKIALPGCHMALLDSHGKRCTFMREVIEAMGLRGAEVLEGRAEDLGRDESLRGTFDLVIARAVAPLPVLLEYAIPFATVGGHLAATKGSAASAEIADSGRALDELQAEIADVVPFEPPQGLRQSLVIVRKVRPTPDRFPRRPGIPTKRPIA